MKLEILGCYAPSMQYKRKKVSCYKIKYGDKNIFLDMGYYMYKSLTMEDMQNTYVIISHNHVDHSYGLFQLMYKLEKWGACLEKKVKVYMPEKSKFKNLFRALEAKRNTVVYAVDKDKKVEIGDLEITFCPTIHKGESYAIKIYSKETDKTFVYTADLAKIDTRLIEFCKDADIVMMEAGHSCTFQPFTLGKYHGYTKTLTRKMLESGAKKIYITHYKAYATEKRIKKYLPEEHLEKFHIVKQGEVLDVL